VPIRGDMQDGIALFEYLAQVVLAAWRAKWEQARAMWDQGCDNQTSVGALRKKLSINASLAVAVQLMSFWESHYDVQVGVNYLPGEAKYAADQVSRWQKRGLADFSEENEYVVALHDLFNGFD
jgi:hypothetical protein